MHRVDVAQATGRSLDLTPGHDGRIVADVVAEWARRHGKPFTLQLTGPAGGTYTEGSGGVELTCDAIAFCRTLAGRAPGSGLLAQQVRDAAGQSGSKSASDERHGRQRPQPCRQGRAQRQRSAA